MIRRPTTLACLFMAAGTLSLAVGVVGPSGDAAAGQDRKAGQRPEPGNEPSRSEVLAGLATALSGARARWASCPDDGRSALRVARLELRRARQLAVAVCEACEARLRPTGGEAAQRWVEPFEGVRPQAEQVMSQARRRMIDGVAVPAKEKLLSLFEPQTQILKRGKAGHDVELGRKVWLDEGEGGIISRYPVLAEPGPEDADLEGSLTGHQARFGKASELLAGDRGVSSPENERLAKETEVKRVVILHAGKPPPERVKQERARWFRQGYRFGAGIEGRISVLKRRFRRDRCLERGKAGAERWAGWAIVTNHRLSAPDRADAGRCPGEIAAG